MLKKQDIICISSIDWDFIWQGHQEIMSAFAKNANRVLFIENTGVRSPGIRDIPRIKNRLKNWFRGVKGIRREKENLYIFSPLVLPFPYSRLARWVNRHLILSILEKWIKAMDFSDPIIWTFLPTPLSLDIADNIVKKMFIYYCIDNFSVSSASAKKIRESERRLLRKVDLVYVTSKALYDYCSKYNDKVYTFPFAVNFSEFERVRLEDDCLVEEFRDIKSPVIGYVGGVHRWIDQRLVKEAAEQYPDYSFVFVGPIQTDISLLEPLKNVYFFGKQVHEKLACFIKNFNVCIIPYVITDYTKNVYPTKLNEYLAMGKPVISTDLPEIVGFNKEYGEIVYVAKDREGFCGHMESIIKNRPILENRWIEVAKENSWENRVEKMSVLIEKEIERKKADIETRWKENLINFYRIARRRVLRITAISIFTYLLLFKSPIIWFLASPLKISDAPRRSDVIVVFGGGVGETGSPGKSTIERARYAVELYKKGYADKILFSSGYTYNYNDAENMKLLAISMGVPNTDIMLEQKANSTYENVIFSKKILDRYRFKSILLVSSPYNMRRADLVFKKQHQDLRVSYSPVENSQFYDRNYGERLGQVRAFIHEYLGIAYYWFKGYL